MQKVKFIPYKCPKCRGSFNFVQRIPSLNQEPIPVHGVCRDCKKEYTITLYVRNEADKQMKKVKSEGSLRRRGNSSLS